MNNQRTRLIRRGVLTALTLSQILLSASAFARGAMPGMTMPVTPATKAAASKQDTGMAGMKRDSAAPRIRSLKERIDPATLPLLPSDLPKWMDGRGNYEVFYKRGAYNFGIYRIPTLAYDFNATGVGHSMAYEDIVRGNTTDLETATFDRINRVLLSPPKLAPTE